MCVSGRKEPLDVVANRVDTHTITNKMCILLILPLLAASEAQPHRSNLISDLKSVTLIICSIKVSRYPYCSKNDFIAR